MYVCLNSIENMFYDLFINPRQPIDITLSRYVRTYPTHVVVALAWSTIATLYIVEFWLIQNSSRLDSYKPNETHIRTTLAPLRTEQKRACTVRGLCAKNTTSVI